MSPFHLKGRSEQASWMVQASASSVLVWGLALGVRACAVPGRRGAGQHGQLCLAGARQLCDGGRRTHLAGESAYAPHAQKPCLSPGNICPHSVHVCQVAEPFI